MPQSLRKHVEGWKAEEQQKDGEELSYRAASTSHGSIHTCITLLRHAGKNTEAKSPNLLESRLPWICYQLHSLNCCRVIIMLL